MKNLFGALLFILPFLTHAQNTDSLAAVRQVDSLIKVSRDLTAKRDFDKALEVNAAAEKIALEKQGQESAVYGNCCFNRGRVNYFKRDFPESEKWWLASQGIREKVFGKEHPDYAANLNSLAVLYKDMGKNEKAESLYLESIAIKEKVLGKQNPEYAAGLVNLAVLYWSKGNYEKAEPLHLEAKGILEKTVNKEHPYYAGSLNNLANLYISMGNYEKAEPLHLEAIAIRGKVLGKEHPDYATSLNNLAILYRQMGNYEKAEMLYLEAKTTRGKALGKEHPRYAETLDNLGNLYQNMGKYEKAEPLYLESIAIHEKVFGKDHPDLTPTLNGIASLYMEMGNYEKAESLFLQAVAILEKALGKEHPEYGLSLNNLAILYYKTGNFEKSEPLFLEAKAIRGKALGKEHILFASTLDLLGNLYQSMGNYEQVELLLTELNLVNQSLLEKAVRHLSEQELESYLNKFSESQAKALSFTQTSSSKKLITTCFDNTLFYKGFLLNAAGQIRRLALTNPAAAEKINEWKAFERRLAAEYVKPLTERKGVAELEAQSNDLQKDLARIVAGYGETMRQVKWQDVQQTLKPDEAAVEFIHYRFFQKKQTDSTMYAALVLLPGATQPQFVLLFEEKQLDSLLLSQGERRADYVNGLYTFSDRGAVAVGKPQKTLYELLWQPLEKNLSGVQTIYFSPSGLLHRLNIAAIPTGEEQTLADRYHLVQLKSTRQLVVPEQPKIVENQAVLFGGIDFERDSTMTAFATADLASRSRGADLGFEKTDSTLRVTYPNFSKNNPPSSKKSKSKKWKPKEEIPSRGGAWSYLPGTEKEIAVIEKLMSDAGIYAQVNRGNRATEEAFKKIGTEKTGSPRVLHLATHGFFFPDPKELPLSSQERGLGGEVAFKLSDHPMLRSGLILAGGNTAWQGAKTLEGREDGILTAYEISQMNLSNTELVVLSACETGLGDIEGNEGVYGLQRAFKIAGAKYLVMSLWQVPDKQTTELMKAFYQKWLVEKMPVPEAFRAAQQAMRERFVDPYAWAGFVLVE